MGPQKRLGFSKRMRDIIRLENECKAYEQKLFLLQKAIRYKQSNEEKELKAKIVQWELCAQTVAWALLPMYQDYKQATNDCIIPDNYGFYHEIEFQNKNNDDQQTLLSNNDNNEDDAKEDTHDNDNNQQDDMSTMLQAFGIDPTLIRYSVEHGDFY
ncbi:uncharacterized protein BX664DRAFT_320507 [Halteromyces radiatus]|uniref:uncharacterized protein n=1 Tax=Halteromyces radiatus TaxID=101107 RepID=UPI00221EA842|nr:uncharacterized protein BX664DRAFT_320507 [Halteromyces radiatus]KAI8099147.1 hypothetical protein BX664DRAFT_320507 [Halteromyces radiatus]